MRAQRFLFKLLGPARYLQWTSRAFFVAYDRGRLRTDPTYYCHYLVNDLVRPGQTVIDIGANLGYYSVLLARRVGTTGKVYSVEPVPLFRRVLARNTRSFPQVQILPYALGDANRPVQLGTPRTAGKFRHGLTHVIDEPQADQSYSHTFTAEMRVPGELFAGLEALHYLKMDVEGYEYVILPHLLPLIRRFRPILQIETPGKDRLAIFELLRAERYRIFYVDAGGMQALPDPYLDVSGDLIYWPQERPLPVR